MPYFGTVRSLLQSVDSHGLCGGLTVGLPSALGSGARRRVQGRVVDFLVYFFKYAPLTLGLDNSSCESDENTDFNVFQTPPNNARGIMHCTSPWAFIHRLRSL